MFEFLPMNVSDRRWFRGMDRQFDLMNRMFEGLNQSMRCDVQDLGDRFELKLDVPGAKKEEIHLQVQDDVLTVKVERQTDSGTPEITAEPAENKGNAEANPTESKNVPSFIHRERSYSRMERRFNVSEIVTDQITAAYENGVLTLVLPKKTPTRPEDNIHTINID